MYDPALVQPMREELTKIGVIEMRTPSEVDEILSQKSGTVMVIVNSVCGCAAGGARPGVALALNHAKKPSHVTTVFAGQDKEATEQARKYFLGYPPTSPSIGLLKDGKLVFMMQRQDIEGHDAEGIAKKLTEAFDKYC
jgi:putative YphP/YqiW family bacilliredoxin